MRTSRFFYCVVGVFRISQSDMPKCVTTVLSCLHSCVAFVPHIPAYSCQRTHLYTISVPPPPSVTKNQMKKLHRQFTGYFRMDGVCIGASRCRAGEGGTDNDKTILCNAYYTMHACVARTGADLQAPVVLHFRASRSRHILMQKHSAALCMHVTP